MPSGPAAAFIERLKLFGVVGLPLHELAGILKNREETRRRRKLSM
jgi:predicted house-cleaning NTP pyrophosphatase (Maf/HAM1 superfamily)